ncbi:hypothetical protein [Thalassospira alkalitolerans]|jgi:hypothetical protein|uniref:hypothetical protein n=1 Tax=Thalassospira alkalitolerans TaxID=1293890 RepID=UPI0030EC338C|tara:strand:+ start:5135 stop:5659 length:525 start_codon:yes stop_codon:yes gene_type:complete
MANTTFSGPVRSEDGFDVVAKNSTTGAFTTEFSLDGSGLQVTPITLGDENTTLTATANAGRTNVVPAITGNRTLTLPSPTAGIWFKFIYGGAAEEAENLIIDTGADANFFIGGVIHLDSNADNVSVYADGNSNSILTLTDFGLFEINILAKDSTNWIIWGHQEGADVPAFTDQS